MNLPLKSKYCRLKLPAKPLNLGTIANHDAPRRCLMTVILPRIVTLATIGLLTLTLPPLNARAEVSGAALDTVPAPAAGSCVGAIAVDGKSIDVKADGVTKLEANQSLIGYSSTRLFYTLGERHTVVAIVIDNKKQGFPVNGTVYQFAGDVTKEALAKWLNNQHSDALFADAPEPVAAHKIPAASFSTAAKKQPGQVQAGIGTWEKFAVKLTLKETKLDSGIELKGFSEIATVYVQVK